MAVRPDPTGSRGYSLLEALFVAAIATTLAAIAIPMSGNVLGYARLSGDARSISNAIALTKMRAASDFTRARLYVDLSGKTHHMETYVKTGTPGWVVRNGSTSLSTNVSLSYGSLSSAPSNTQATIGQAPACLDNANAAISNTACIIFNSRGVPVDSSGAPTAADAIYITDGTAVYGDDRGGQRDDSAVAKHSYDGGLGPAMKITSERGMTLVETTIACSHPAGRHARVVVDGGLGDDLYREPRTSGSADDRVRAGQDGAAAGAGVHGPCHQTRSSFRPRRAAEPDWRSAGERAHPHRSMATWTGWRTTARCSAADIGAFNLVLRARLAGHAAFEHRSSRSRSSRPSGRLWGEPLFRNRR